MSGDNGKQATEAKHEQKIKGNIWKKVGDIAQTRSTLFIILIVMITLGLVYPLVNMAPTERASDSPGGDVFDHTEEIESKLPSAAYSTNFIVESRDGDILEQEELWELYQNQEELRNSEFGKSYLYSGFDAEKNRWVQGVFTIADAVQESLLKLFDLGLNNATDDHVKVAIHFLSLDPTLEEVFDSLSLKTTKENKTVLGQPITVWTSPAFGFTILSDNEKVQNDFEDTLDQDYQDKVVEEYFDMEIQDYLRGDQDSYKLWGVGIDLNIESEEEASLVIPLIAAAVVLMMIIVTVQFRSPIVMALTLVGLTMLIIWLKGMSNLIGLKSSLTLDIIVPVAIMVLGVDYVIHSLHRYNEEKKRSDKPSSAFSKSIAGVGGAMTLAMASTTVAFLSNMTSEIESIFEFGLGTAIAIIAAYLIMGFFIPAIKMKIDMFRSGKEKPNKNEDLEEKKQKKKGLDLGDLIGRSSLWLAKKWKILLPAILIISLVSGYLAIQLEAQLDPKDYLSQESDFVISLDKVDEHIGDKAGEPAYIYLQGDLSQQEALDAVIEMKSNMEDNEHVARDQDDGSANIHFDLLTYLEEVVSRNYTRKIIENANPGLYITDNDTNGIPDSPDQLRAVYSFIYQYGIPLNDTFLLYTPNQVHEGLYIDPDEENTFGALYWVGVPDTVDQKTIQASEDEIKKDMESLENIDSIDYFWLTGPGYERDRTLTSITQSLNMSILVAVILCFFILFIAFRSFKYAIVTVIPEILVAAWLYAFMFVAGFQLNIVTATIAAISIGVGIDYSVYITSRFRQELKETKDREKAIEMAAKHAGAALLGSAASTMFGFAIIAFAPMPMFSSFGLLTALMIAMAFIAALVVLPALLYLVSGREEKKR